MGIATVVGRSLHLAPPFVGPVRHRSSAPGMSGADLSQSGSIPFPNSVRSVTRSPAEAGSPPGAAGQPGGTCEVVAIDGPSGAGKSTVARLLAQQLDYQYLDTGAMYRAITWHL